LQRRNDGLSEFWRGRPINVAPLHGRVLIIDAEDDFTAMLARMTEAIGLGVRIDTRLRGHYDAVILGPGPGDPRDRADPRIARLHEIARRLLQEGTPLLAVCLGHQVLADELGLAIRRLDEPAQGVQRRIPWFGRVGFYNTFVAVSSDDNVLIRADNTANRTANRAGNDPGAANCADIAPNRAARRPATVAVRDGRGAEWIRILRDPGTGAVHAMRMPRARSIQFHVESVLTEHGPAILRRMLAETLSEATSGIAATASPAQTWPTSGQ
jgi:phenazine biosynthesis protein phzE